MSGVLKRKNTTPSCGCLTKKRRIERNQKFFAGQKFGRLTIIEEHFEYSPTKVLCKCDCGKLFIITRADVVSGHTQSCGCLQRERASEYNTKDWTGVISRSGVEFIKQDHKNDRGQWLWLCKCGFCGKEFIELPARINNGHVSSCGCFIRSSPEKYISTILSDLNINYQPQYGFKDCKYKQELKFDFAILNNNDLLGLIEYDGKQHFHPIDWFGGEEAFDKTIKRDAIKNEYCLKHNIPLLRLPYTLSYDEIKNKIHEYHLSLTTAGCM